MESQKLLIQSGVIRDILESMVVPPTTPIKKVTIVRILSQAYSLKIRNNIISAINNAGKNQYFEKIPPSMRITDSIINFNDTLMMRFPVSFSYDF